MFGRSPVAPDRDGSAEAAEPPAMRPRKSRRSGYEAYCILSVYYKHDNGAGCYHGYSAGSSGDPAKTDSIDEPVNRNDFHLADSVTAQSVAADARMTRIEENLDGLIRAITAEHGNGKGKH